MHSALIHRTRKHVALRGVVLALLVVLVVPALGVAHDMFLKPARFRAPSDSDVLVRVINGTFTKSENAITRDRVADISVAGPAGRERIAVDKWSERGDTSTVSIHTGKAGTYVLGASTRPRILALPAKDFNQYLADDGIPDVLAARTRAGQLDVPSKERYHKHIKALIQVGDVTSPVDAALGYPAELIPLDNPYEGSPRTLRFRALVDGKPVANQLVVYGGRRGATRIEPTSLRSDASGIVGIPVRGAATWYVKFIHMAPVTGDTAATYESKWASITFETR